jgi:nucleotide-binding universal stress UspA family protein
MFVLARAASFARAIGITTLRVLTVQSERTDQAPADKSGWLDSLERQARGILKHQGVERAGPSMEVRRGPVVPQILAAVTETDSDLLAIGYHRGGLPGFIEAGSTGRQLIHTAPCAVLTIPL